MSKVAGPPMPTPVTTGLYREGVAWDQKDLDKYVLAGGLDYAMLQECTKSEKEQGYVVMSDVEQAYKDSASKVDKAREIYNKVLLNFRSTIKNDLSSIASSSEKITKQAGNINKAYLQTIETLTSDDMQKAIDNAERLANALKMLSEINPQSFDFILMSNKAGE